MSNIKRFDIPRDGNECMHEDPDGEYVQYDDHLAAVERLKAMLPPTAHTGVRNGPGEGSWSVFAGKVVEERDEAQAEVEQLWRDLTAADGTIDRLRTELAQQDHDLKTAREEVERLTVERDTAYISIESLRNAFAEQDHELDTAREDVLRLTAERDMARAEVRRLIAERDQPESRPKGREVGRFGLDGHYLYAMEPTRLIDEDIWREAFMTMLPSYPWEKAAAHADSALAAYRKRWPR